MLIEQSAYANRWRRVAPAAKGVAALGGLAASYTAATPTLACGVAALFSALTVCGAGVPPGRYLRVAVPPLLFLLVSALSLAVSVRTGATLAEISWQLAPDQWPRIAEVGARSLAGLTALLFLAMTTPLTELVALLRRIGTPEVLLDIMVLCYRMLFVFSVAIGETTTAQASRLGYSTTRRTLHSLGILTANLAVQVWQRSHALHVAALARNGDGPLRFVEQSYPRAGRDLAMALGGTALLLILVVGMA